MFVIGGDLKRREKISARLGVTFEGFNLTNNAAITSRTVRSGAEYFVPRALVNPRRFRLGAVYRF